MAATASTSSLTAGGGRQNQSRQSFTSLRTCGNISGYSGPDGLCAGVRPRRSSGGVGADTSYFVTGDAVSAAASSSAPSTVVGAQEVSATSAPATPPLQKAASAPRLLRQSSSKTPTLPPLIRRIAASPPCLISKSQSVAAMGSGGAGLKQLPATTINSGAASLGKSSSSPPRTMDEAIFWVTNFVSASTAESVGGGLGVGHKGGAEKKRVLCFKDRLEFCGPDDGSADSMCASFHDLANAEFDRKRRIVRLQLRSGAAVPLSLSLKLLGDTANVGVTNARGVAGAMDGGRVLRMVLASPADVVAFERHAWPLLFGAVTAPRRVDNSASGGTQPGPSLVFVRH
eukprot:TRINITY_DN70351_c0_g1_i1.p1 TRINITY_DN70351_c0_g1~~TRINITY_DN70351_c0_g1_i1.p1  ORF type:complete len:343 (+),score=60.12 TRINITY_DN70351_c0_g1_i1:80-1108(+)